MGVPGSRIMFYLCDGDRRQESFIRQSDLFFNYNGGVKTSLSVPRIFHQVPAIPSSIGTQLLYPLRLRQMKRNELAFLPMLVMTILSCTNMILDFLERFKRLRLAIPLPKLTNQEAPCRSRWAL